MISVNDTTSQREPDPTTEIHLLADNPLLTDCGKVVSLPGGSLYTTTNPDDADCAACQRAAGGGTPAVALTGLEARNLADVHIIDAAEHARQIFGDKADEILGVPLPEHDYRIEMILASQARVTFARGATADHVAAYLEREAALGSVGCAQTAPRYTAPLTLPAAVMDVPEHGPKWQVLDAKDEETWHDLTEVVDCANPQCEVRTEWQGDGEPDCVVLVSAAYADGFAHWDVEDLVSVRIPAGER